MAVLHRLSLIPALTLYESRFLDSFLYASHVYLGVSEYVVRVFLVEQRSTLFHGFLSIEYERQFLVYYTLFKYAQSL